MAPKSDPQIVLLIKICMLTCRLFTWMMNRSQDTTPWYSPCNLVQSEEYPLTRDQSILLIFSPIFLSSNSFFQPPSAQNFTQNLATYYYYYYYYYYWDGYKKITISRLMAFECIHFLYYYYYYHYCAKPLYRVYTHITNNYIYVHFISK